MASFTHPTLGLLGLLPIPVSAPHKETLSWLTEIQPAYDGSEFRLQLRNKPRQATSNVFYAQPERSKDAFNTVYGGVVRRWAVPLWSLARPAGTIAGGQLVLSVDTRYSDFRVGDAVLLIGGCGRWFVDFISALGDESITLQEGVSELRSAFAVPLRIGRLVGNAQKSTSGYGSQWRTNMEVDDNLLLEPGAPAQYYGDDIYLTPGLLDGDTLSENVIANRETSDFEVGLVESYTPWPYNRTARPYKVITETDEEAWLFREWLYRRAGRYRAFWQPTFENDVRLYQTGMIASSVTVLEDSRIPYAQTRTNLAFGLRDGSWLPRRVTNDVSGGVNVRTLTLDAPLNVNAADIVAISYLGYRRLDADSIDLNWIGNGCCEATVPVLELTP